MCAKNFIKQKNALLLVILSIGAFLRFYNLNWDLGLTFHPDERNIDAAVSRVEFFDQMDPKFFAYGGFPIYLYNATTEVVTELTENESWKYDWGRINLVGRTYSAIFSVLTIIAIYLLSIKLFLNSRIGLISATLAAFTPSFIQTAHFGITESFLTLMAIVITYLSIILFEKFNLKNIIILAILMGISISAKTSAVSFLIIPLTSFTVKLLKEKQKLKSLKRLIPLGLLFTIIVILTFTLISPFTFLSWEKFMESMQYEGGVVNGSRPVPYTHQFIGTIPYLFQLKNVLWQIGFVAILSYIGVALLLINLAKKRSPELLIFLSFPLVYFGYIGSWHTKFIRYMLPILPALLISAAYLLNKIIHKSKVVGIVVASAAILITVFWGLAFFSIYKREQTRVVASEWIYKNIPHGSRLLTEHWDDGLPIDLHDKGLRGHEKYTITQLTIYEPDNEVKIEYYANMLPVGDYIIINSRRLYGTLINLEEEYPLTSKYYKLLFSDQLGYKKIAEFTSYPSIFGIEINDDKSEETFQVYDHNKVMVFENSLRLDKNEIITRLEKH